MLFLVIKKHYEHQKNILFQLLAYFKHNNQKVWVKRYLVLYILLFMININNILILNKVNNQKNDKVLLIIIIKRVKLLISDKNKIFNGVVNHLVLLLVYMISSVKMKIKIIILKMRLFQHKVKIHLLKIVKFINLVKEIFKVLLIKIILKSVILDLLVNFHLN